MRAWRVTPTIDVVGMLVGAVVAMFVAPIGVGFGISGGLFLGILMATIAWMTRRQVK
ncbi:hypothetical protein ACIP5T_18245 [Microbacterium sp. NPDC088619]|uniref:hypothetical protein n=1 Tax=Microbacterium sp. NPDC088619 TaxID=3364196 RepID=UPI0038004991